MAGAPARFDVLLTRSAERDLESIHDYLTQSDCLANANRMLDRLLEVLQTLSRFPERGSHPKELGALGIKEFRQVLLKPYRLIYRVSGKQVIIYLIADGRRDMHSLLASRLLSA